jgi:ribokinase
MKHVVVIGSSNTDMVIKTRRFPEPGETVLGGSFFMFPGGKGANQAVAAARLGANVSFICSVGNDLFGTNALEQYKKEGIDISGVYFARDVASGVALITINVQGENEIVVAPGANEVLNISHIDKNLGLLNNADVLLTQLETPIDILQRLVRHCGTTGQPLILNPASGRHLDEVILDGLFLITPNQSETEMLTRVRPIDENSAERAAGSFLNKGVENVVITMGAGGSFFMNKNEQFMTPAPKVSVKDTTAAGDIFNGALAVALAENKSWQEAIRFATTAAAISVGRMGAQFSAPYLDEVV